MYPVESRECSVLKNMPMCKQGLSLIICHILEYNIQFPMFNHLNHIKSPIIFSRSIFSQDVMYDQSGLDPPYSEVLKL